MLLLGQLQAHDLVDVRTVNSRIRVQMAYAGSSNPLGRPIYPSGRCLVVHEVAERLSRVQQQLEKYGYGLKILDAYRPYSLEAVLWQAYRELPQPAAYGLCRSAEDSAGHNRGTAVDVTLVCLSGFTPAMPTPFASRSPAAGGACRHLPAHVYHNRGILDKAMRQQGFIPSPTEWWHYDFQSWSCYPIEDVPLGDKCFERTPHF
jgi:D-alanyl-D-alanine dipeptidase